jgi:hypothetical protein
MSITQWVARLFPCFSMASYWSLLYFYGKSNLNFIHQSSHLNALICIICSMKYFFSFSSHLAGNRDNVQLCLWSLCIPHKENANPITMALQMLYTGRYALILWANFDFFWHTITQIILKLQAQFQAPTSTLPLRREKLNTVEPRSIVFQGDGENKRWMRENDDSGKPLF